MAIVYTLVSGTRLIPLLVGFGSPPARPRPGPGGSVQRFQIANSARATNRPVTRISPGTGDSLPTPHSRDWYENKTFTGCCRNNQRLRRLRHAYQCQDTPRMSGEGARGPRSPKLGLDYQRPTAGEGGAAGPGAGRPTQSFAMRMSNGASEPATTQADRLELELIEFHRNTARIEIIRPHVSEPTQPPGTADSDSKTSNIPLNPEISNSRIHEDGLPAFESRLPDQAASPSDQIQITKWTAEFCNPSLPLVASPIPHPCALAPSPPHRAAQVTLPPTHHAWLSHTGPGPSVT
jgi:hypothetical protein